MGQIHPRTVGLMPGHGGTNTGTTEGGIIEKDFVLDFCRVLAHRCKSVWPDDETHLLRTSDYVCGLNKGGALARDAGCSLALVVHVNAGPPGLSGGLMFCMPSDWGARDVGRAIISAYPAELSPARREPVTINREDPDHWTGAARNVLLPYRKVGVSAVLVELFYATHAADVAYALTADGVESMVTACLHGIAMHRASAPVRYC